MLFMSYSMICLMFVMFIVCVCLSRVCYSTRGIVKEEECLVEDGENMCRSLTIKTRKESCASYLCL